jgi:quercetin dioxygenase-like cupin family protein
LDGVPGMEVICSIVEFKPGDESTKHFHHGIEAAYIVQGSMIQEPGKEPRMLATGTNLINLRNVFHSGFKVVGDQSLKIYTVHIVDKNKPLYDFNQ